MSEGRLTFWLKAEDLSTLPVAKMCKKFYETDGYFFDVEMCRRQRLFAFQGFAFSGRIQIAKWRPTQIVRPL